MKVEVSENKSEKNIELPCLMVHHCGLIILATKMEGRNYSGIVLKKISVDTPVGDYGEFNNGFKPFNGSITLSND